MSTDSQNYLFDSIIIGDIKTVEILLSKKDINVDFKNILGITALMQASKLGHKDIVNSDS